MTISKFCNQYDNCALCNGPLRLILPLAPTPPANEIMSTYYPEKELFDLNLMKCYKCNHLQLDTEINMRRLFKHYVYTSNTSSSNYNYFDSYATEMVNKFHPKFVVDIGSNDGLFLHFFQKAGCQILGVDPAENIAEIANNNKVETKCAFFNELESIDIKSRHGKSDLITCNNMFAHNRNLDEVLLGVKNLLADGGTFVFEVSYAMKLLEHGIFDLIYHEHFHHWHLSPALEYVRKFGLEVYDAQLIEQTHGGSLRVYVQHAKDFVNLSPRAVALLADEQARFENLVQDFSNQVSNLKGDLTALLEVLKAQGKHISIMGYPAKACTLSYYFNLDKFITKVYDNNPLKIGKYTQQGFLIEPATQIYKDKPDYLLVLSWNYKDELLKKHKLFAKTGGKFIIPFPHLEVI